MPPASGHPLSAARACRLGAAFGLALLPSLGFAQLLTLGPSPRTLGPDRTNHETSSYRVGNFGWFGISITERHG
ncbi:MAG: hypothetical protein FJ382_01310 [Verrucomicrobia bacterium]|nr:hypothetical protein [Verrucomicrobiota bacterium]